MAFTLTPIAAKDSAGTAIGGGLMAADVAGGGAGPFFMFHGLVDGLAGVNRAQITTANALKVDASAATSLLALESGGNLAAIAANSAGALVAGSALIGQIQINDNGSPMGTMANFGTTPGAVKALNANASLFVGTVAAVSGNGGVGTGVQRVAIASDNSPFGVNLAPLTTGGLSRSRTLIPNNTTAIVVKAGAGTLYKIRATNNSATIAYIKLYDATSATAGSGTPVDTIMIPAATAGGAGVADLYSDFGAAHATGITYVVTTGIADADTTAPAASALVVTMFYK